ncbi:MAG: Crp/Fnr family transcriptional regulator [Spirochaetales bacterium]|nr:Crp/Fnr family transcriptional regulator [Spirochaetales bacterium]
MTTDEIEKIIEKSEYFGGLEKRARRSLAEICLIKELGKNDVLFHEGRAGYAFFVLVSGAIGISRTAEDGRETVIKVLKPGEVFGEVVLFEVKEYPARARAVEQSSVLVIPKKQIDCLLEQAPFRRAFLGLVMKKLRYLTDRLLLVTAGDVEERFFRFLAEQYGDRTAFRIGLSKKEIAAAVGATPETFSRLIARLSQEGRISWKGHLLKIL